jgi:membrane protease YdiL (CAAX protease family)
VASQPGKAVLSALVLMVAEYVIAAFIDHRRVRDFGFHFRRQWWIDFGFGAVLGAVLMTVVFTLGIAFGCIRITGLFTAVAGFSFGTLVIAYALIFTAVSIAEELLVRGILLTNLAEGLSGFGPLSNRGGTGIAVALTAALFGILHMNNLNATFVSTAAVALGGVFLALGYALTGDLAIPVGLHLSWNYFQGVVFGFPVSGNGVGVAFIETELSGPSAMTGGDFGPEAGLLGVFVVFLGMALIVWWVSRRSDVVDIHPGIWTPELR